MKAKVYIKVAWSFLINFMTFSAIDQGDKKTQADHVHSSHRASRAAIRQVIASASDDTPSSEEDIL